MLQDVTCPRLPDFGFGLHVIIFTSLRIDSQVNAASMAPITAVQFGAHRVIEQALGHDASEAAQIGEPLCFSLLLTSRCRNDADGLP